MFQFSGIVNFSVLRALRSVERSLVRYANPSPQLWVCVASKNQSFHGFQATSKQRWRESLSSRRTCRSMSITNGQVKAISLNGFIIYFMHSFHSRLLRWDRTYITYLSTPFLAVTARLMGNKHLQLRLSVRLYAALYYICVTDSALWGHSRGQNLDRFRNSVFVSRRVTWTRLFFRCCTTSNNRHHNESMNP